MYFTLEESSGVTLLNFHFGKSIIEEKLGVQILQDHRLRSDRIRRGASSCPKRGLDVEETRVLASRERGDNGDRRQLAPKTLSRRPATMSPECFLITDSERLQSMCQRRRRSWDGVAGDDSSQFL